MISTALFNSTASYLHQWPLTLQTLPSAIQSSATSFVIKSDWNEMISIFKKSVSAFSLESVNFSIKSPVMMLTPCHTVTSLLNGCVLSCVDCSYSSVAIRINRIRGFCNVDNKIWIIPENDEWMNALKLFQDGTEIPNVITQKSSLGSILRGKIKS